MTFLMEQNHVAPRIGVRTLTVRGHHILLDSIGRFFPHAEELIFQTCASLSPVHPLLTQTPPLINIRRLHITDVICGLEYLLDGVMLPRLQSLHGTLLSLFVAFASRANPMKTLDTVDHLMVTEPLNDIEGCFSFKQWHIVLDVLPRLRTLLIQIGSPRCPPIGLAELFLSYIRRTIRSPLTLFSCFLVNRADQEKKEKFINHLRETLVNEYSSIMIASHFSRSLDLWM